MGATDELCSGGRALPLCRLFNFTFRTLLPPTHPPLLQGIGKTQVKLHSLQVEETEFEPRCNFRHQRLHLGAHGKSQLGHKA